VKSSLLAGLVGLLLVSTLIHLGGCGGAVATLGKSQVAGAAVRAAATPLLAARCEAIAAKCPAGKAEDCAGLSACWALRRGIFGACDAVQIAVAAGLAADVAGSTSSVAGWVVKATVALAEAARLAKEVSP
jgi:hypothetical protein